jgi:hypothetical protein
MYAICPAHYNVLHIMIMIIIIINLVMSITQLFYYLMFLRFTHVSLYCGLLSI